MSAKKESHGKAGFFNADSVANAGKSGTPAVRMPKKTVPKLKNEPRRSILLRSFMALQQLKRRYKAFLK